MRDGSCYIQECLDSMHPNVLANLLLIDDGSSDDTVDRTKQACLISNMYRFVQKTTNEGLRDSWIYAYQAAKSAGRKYLLRTDADIIYPDWNVLAILEEHMEQHPECGAVGFTQYLHDGRLWSAGDIFTDCYKHIHEPIDQECYRICPSVMGCFVCHRIKALDSVGGFTAPKFMRAETEDLHIRMSNAGWEIHCLPYTFKHMHGLTAGAKKGEYNNNQVGKRVDEWMWGTHRVDFYGQHGGTKDARLAIYKDRPL
jgi:GT2 family glycosyltransferase